MRVDCSTAEATKSDKYVYKDNEIILNLSEKILLMEILMKVSNSSRFPKFKDLYGKIVMLDVSPSENPQDKDHVELDNENHEE